MEEREQSPRSCKKQITAFVACSKTKRNRATHARFLYQGNLFKKALLYAEKNYNYVYILSALYGVVHPDEIIEPYDKTLIKMTVDERKSWYLMVENQLENLKRPFIFFTGKLYNEKFEGYKPLNGLGLGEQLQWFNRQLKKSKRKGFIK